MKKMIGIQGRSLHSAECRAGRAGGRALRTVPTIGDEGWGGGSDRHLLES